jgi:predicted metal-dependent enzyme (double-stranded beta helix superfamily)
MPGFTIEGFAQGCKDALAAAENGQGPARAYLQQMLTKNAPEAVVEALDAAVPAGADIGEMIVHTSPELTMLYGRIPPRFQSGIHNHTIFACIGQLIGQEKNIFYERDPDGTGLRVIGEKTASPGDVIQMPADAIHSIENPGNETSSALHVYGGDFGAVMSERSLWTSEGHEQQPFSFELLLRESASAMKRDDNVAGLAALVEAIPAAAPLVE